LSARARLDSAGGWRSTLDGELVGFSRSGGGVDGWRADVTPALTWQYLRPGYYVRPSVALDLTSYRLDHVGTGDPGAPTRSLPLISFDTGMQLERSVGRDQTRLLTLEPRLLYVYIPYREQSQLPLFDTGLPDPNFISLFRTNRYVGADRIGDANKVTLGVSSRMYEAASGKQYLSATFGQSFNFDTPRVTLPNETLDTRRRSDLIANVEMRAYHNLGMRVDLAWNPQLSSAQKAQVALQYRPASNQVINVGYRFDRGSVEQTDVSAAWPIGRRWELYARSVYSLQDHSFLDNFAGVRYRSDCWGLRAVMRRALTTRTGQRDTGIYLQFELTGLSSVGTGADTFLQESIQGYSAAEPRP
jgi:LPS-assembly protein